MAEFSGLLARCRVRHLYAAHLVCVDLLTDDGAPTRDWLTVQLPIAPPTILRPGDPPPWVPLRIFDPAAAPDAQQSTPLPGPCPTARQATAQILAGARYLRAWVPLQREHYLASLEIGSLVQGDLLLGGSPPLDPTDARLLSQMLITSGIAGQAA